MFYCHKGMKDGRLNFCKKCVRLRVKDHRKNNIEKVRAYDRRRAEEPKRRLASALYLKWYRISNPQRYKSQTALNNAVRDGRVKKSESCVRCGGKKNIEGHHQDYSKPLDVVWLCSVCHKDLHFNSYKEFRL